MGLQHFSHEHELIFIEDAEFYDEDGNIHCCNACAKPMTLITPSYSCPECSFYLHKSCADLPQQKIHPLHPDHTLTLLPKPLYDGQCHCCDSELHNFTYSCSMCKFDLDIECAFLKDHSFEHPSHKHPLTGTKKQALFECDGCGIEHKGYFYECHICSFAIHHDCLSFSYQINYPDHPEHTLALAYSTPPQYISFRYYCEICNKKIGGINRKIDASYAVYYCGECRYFIHAYCATSRYESFMSILHPWTRAEWTKLKADLDRPGIVQIPVSDESTSLVDHFRQGKGGREIKDLFIHFSHPHPLVLFNKDEDDDENKLISEGKCCDLHNKKNDRLLCSGCIQPIITTTSFYRCTEKCGFFIHMSCAELPSEVEHPGHPGHPLVLFPRSPTPFGFFTCKGCRRFGNGFVYSCAECEDYKLDIICGSLPGSIQHEAHKEHILSIKPSLTSRCRASGVRDKGASSRGFSFAYHCESCDFELLPSSILFPREIRHRYDKKHPFILSYEPVKGIHHSGEYLCDICEVELNPRWWFYHCIACDHSIHIWCLPQFDVWSRLKFGSTYTINNHTHPLNFLPVIKPNTFFHTFPHVITDITKCDTIGTCTLQGRTKTIFKCTFCSFKLHRRCAIANGEIDVPTC